MSADRSGNCQTRLLESKTESKPESSEWGARQVPGPGQPIAPPASEDEAMAMTLAGLEYLAAADTTALTGEQLAARLRHFGDVESVHAAAHASTLTAFRACGAFEADGSRTARSWLVWQTQITSGAATRAVESSKRLDAHPLVAAALTRQAVSPSWAQRICEWSD